MLVAFSFPESDFRDIFQKVASFFKQKGMKSGIDYKYQWPHVSVFDSGNRDLSKEEILEIKEKLKNKPTFKVVDFAIFGTVQSVADYLVLILDRPKEWIDASLFFNEKYSAKEKTPHCSIISVPKTSNFKMADMKEELLSLLERYKNKSCTTQYLQFWKKNEIPFDIRDVEDLSYYVDFFTEDWAHEVGQLRSELGELEEIYKDFYHISWRLGDIDDIVPAELVKPIERAINRALIKVQAAEARLREITDSPKPSQRNPIRHSVPIGDPKREMPRISTDIARLSVRVRNIGQATADVESLDLGYIRDMFEHASEILRKAFVQFEKLIS